MGFRRFASILILCGGALALFGAIAPDVADRYLPTASPYARQLRTYLPASLLALHPDPGKDAPLASAAAPASASSSATTRPPVVVVVGQAEKQDFPWVVDQIGTVQPVASVALRPHFDSTVDKVFVADGAAVKAGDVLIKMDSRQSEAQLKGAQAQLAKDQAQLEQAKRDVARYTDLVSRSATPVLNLDNAKTSVAATEAAILGDQAAIDSLTVQLGFATINQISPIYVAFSVSQTLLAPLREAMAAGAPVTATPQGSTKQATGKLALIENSIDAGSGSIVARAIFDNANELLWPGQLCNLKLTLRIEPNTIVVPREAMQNGQSGTYVFVISDGVAHVQSVAVSRTQGDKTIVTEGLKGGEAVVVDGALLLVEGSKVEVRAAQKGAS